MMAIRLGYIAKVNDQLLDTVSLVRRSADHSQLCSDRIYLSEVHSEWIACRILLAGSATLSTLDCGNCYLQALAQRNDPLPLVY